MRTLVLSILLLPGCDLLFPPAAPPQEPPELELREGKGTLVLRRGQAQVLVGLEDGRQERHRLSVGAVSLSTSDAGTLTDLEGLVEVVLSSWSTEPPHAEARDAKGEAVPPALDERVRSAFFDSARVPTAHFQLVEIESVAQPFGLDESAVLQAVGLVILDGRALRVGVPVEVTRTRDGYRFETSEPLDVDLAQLDKEEALTAMAGLLELGTGIEPVVGLVLELDTAWKRPGDNAAMPITPPVTVTRVTGDGAIDLSNVKPKVAISPEGDTGQ